ncbi:MAG: hypothetical protein ACI8T1_002613 [Verrucomicrobiales bacterium]|jgi:hypothetical protein
MATTPDSLPKDPDDLEHLPSKSVPRSAGIPDAPSDRDHVADLSAAKQGMPSFPTQDRRQAKNLEDMDLDGQADGTALRETIKPQTQRTPKKGEPSRRPAMAAEVAAAAEESAAEKPLSGNEQEEELRRKGGRPKSVRPTDFEPMAWESSKTKVDYPEPDEEGQMPPRVGVAGCAHYLINGLKAAWGRLNVIEMASVAAFLIVALIGLFGFRNLVHSGQQVEEVRQLSLASLDFPSKGELLTVADIKATWRAPQPGEIVRPDVLMVPEVSVQLSGGSGFLRMLYRDEQGKIRGDIMVQQITNGSANGGTTFTAICSEGYQNAMNLVECQAGRLEPWTVEVFESRDYNVTIDDWVSLARFEMPSGTADGDKSEG